MTTKLTKEEWKSLLGEIQTVCQSESDKSLNNFLLKITTQEEMKKISGIYKNRFILGAIAYFKTHKEFTPNYREKIILTLRVYADNIGRAGKL